MKVTEIAVRRPVFTLVVYLATAVFGLFALSRLPLDLYPEMENPVVSVVTGYPGASSWDVEEKVTKPLEKGLGILPGLKEITSKTMEGVSAVFLKFQYDTSLNDAAADIRNALDWVERTLPDGIEDPMLFKFNTAYFPIYFAALVSDTVDVTTEGTYLDEHVIQDLQSLPGVGSVQMFHVAPEEVHVDVRLDDIERRGLTLTQVTQALAASNVSMPAGKVEDGRYDLPVRVPAEYRAVDEIADLVVGLWEGQPVHLRDVADVRDTHRRLPNIATLDGRTVSVLFVQKQSGANTVEVARAVRARVAEIAPHLVRGIRVVPIWDASEFIESLVGNLYRSLVVGGALVVLVVIVFLRRVRASLVVAMALPGSLIIAFLMLYLRDYTLNAVSLMAMILAVGMVVDNSIVVLENITRHLDRGRAPVEASLRGTREVGLAITASTTTTVGIFLPMIFVSGLVSILFGQLAFVLVITLVASLVTSVFLTPMLTSRLLKPGSGTSGAQGILGRVESAYGRMTAWAVRHRRAVYAVSTAVLAASVLTLTRVGFDFLPLFDTGEVRATVELPVGTGIEESARVAEGIAARLRDIPELERLYVQAGESEDAWGAAMGQTEGTHLIQIHMQFGKVDRRERGIRDIAEDVRRVVRETDGLVGHDIQVGDQGLGGMMGGKPMVVEVLGSHYDRLKEAAYEVERVLKGIEGTRDVAAEVPYEKPEVQVHLDRRRMSLLGVTALQASEVVRTAMLGTTVTRFRGQGRDIEVVVRLREEDRDRLDKVGRLLAPSVTGPPASLRNFSRVESGFAPIVIDRSSQMRVLRVGANLSGTSLGSASREFERQAADLRARYPDVVFRFGGQAKEQQDTALDLMVILFLGVLLTYFIMAAQFESFLDPFVIMFAVPFAFTGSFLALSVVGENFNVLAFLGLIMLVGIVVNNAIVLVDYINRMRGEGTPLHEAVVETARRRLRPILMTSITTMAGVLPLALSSGEGYEMWRPIGVTMVGGLLVSSLVTLVLIPSLYVTFERFRVRARG